MSHPRSSHRAATAVTTTVVLLAGFAMTSVAPAARQAPAPASATAARDLSTLLAEKKLTSIATDDPVEKGKYIAALNVAGVQLLVAQGKPEDTAMLNYMLFEKNYMGVYQSLNSGGITERITFEDMGFDGLKPAPAQKDGPKDTCTRGTTRVAFDGDFKTRKIKEAEYMQAFNDADRLYARLLGALIAELKK